MMINRQIVLKSRPIGIPRPEDFELVMVDVPPLRDGEFLVENHFLSVDPAQRGYVNDESNYAPPLPIGSVMRGMAVGRVSASRHADFSIGSYVYGWFGWQDYCVATPDLLLRRVDPEQVPLSMNAGLLGINGLTAYIALHDIGRLKPDQTVLVTAAAGAVGSVVGQLAQQAGAKAVAVVSSDEKGKLCLSEYGYAGYIDRSKPLAPQIEQACPKGIDVFFDNTGGSMSDIVIRHMALFGRVIQCGTMSIAAWNPPPIGLRNDREVLTRRLRVEGFVIFDHIARFDSVANTLAKMVRSGFLRYAEHITDELVGAPQALVDVYAGKNRGKRLIRLK